RRSWSARRSTATAPGISRSRSPSATTRPSGRARTPAAAVFPKAIRCSPASCPPPRKRSCGTSTVTTSFWRSARRSSSTTREGLAPSLPAGTKVFQLIDAPDVAAWLPTGTSVVTSLRLGLADLLARPAPPARPRQQARSKPARIAPGATISVAYLMQTLHQVRPARSIIVEEAPTSRRASQTHLPIDRSDGFYTCGSGGLGYGIAAAVGVALAKPDDKVIALIGDGSSMYAIQALWTAGQLRLPVT